MVAFLYENENAGTTSLFRELLQLEDVPCELIAIGEAGISQQRGAADVLLLDGNCWDLKKRSLTVIEHLKHLRLQHPPFAGTAIILTFLRPDELRFLPGGQLLALPGVEIFRLPIDPALLAKTISAVSPLTNEQLTSAQHQLLLNELSASARSLAHNHASRLFTLNSELPKICILCAETMPDTALIEHCLAPIRLWWQDRRMETTEFFREVVKTTAALKEERPDIGVNCSPNSDLDVLMTSMESLVGWPLGKDGTVAGLLVCAQKVQSVLDRLFDDLRKLSQTETSLSC